MHVEPEFEGLLGRLVPGVSELWRGASPNEIDEVEAYAGHSLPPFYRWFLTRMGRDLGSLANPRRNLSVDAVLSIYRSGFKPPHPTLLLIGCEPDEPMPTYLYYDLNKRSRQDAWVCNYHPRGGPRQDDFETLREMLASGTFTRSWKGRSAQRCSGTLIDERRNVLSTLEPVIEGLGFTKVLQAGAFCGLYEGPGMAMSCTVTPGEVSKRHHFFDLFGGDDTALRSVLGTIGVETSLEVKVREWRPGLRHE